MKFYQKKVVWFTGLSGAGKSTLADKLVKHIKKKKYKYFRIDGDIFRNNTSNRNSFSKANIRKNNFKIIELIDSKVNNFDFIVVSVISPLKKTRLKAKKLFNKNYIEVFVKSSLKNLIKRDTKGLYKLAKENKIKNLIGFNSKITYEFSKYKKIVVNTGKLNLNQSLFKIKSEMRKNFKVKI